MKRIILISFLFISFLAKAQQYTNFQGYGFKANRLWADSVSIQPSDTVKNKVAKSIAILNNKLYVADGTKWIIAGGGAVDTFLLSTRAWRQKGIDSVSANVNFRVKYTDTALMLLPYLRKADTISLSNRIDARVKYTDTAAMLSPYLRTANATTGTVTSVATNYGLLGGTITTSGTLSADTSKLSTKAWRQKGIDSVQNNLTLGLANKLNISDTASMLSPYSKLKSVGLTMPSAFNVANSPLTSDGTIAVSGAGTASQYVRGDGQLASFPTSSAGGGASVSYYLNGSVNKGTFGGQTYYEMSRTAIVGGGTDFTRTNAQGDGLIAQFITDTITNLLIPAGNWNLELYFNASSSGGTPSFYVELYKYNGTTFTLISSNSISPEFIAFGTIINPYFTALAVPETILSGTDRLAIRVFVNTSGKSISLHTENSHLCQIITTFTTGLTTLNGLSKQVQYFATGTSGTDFNISSSNDTHTFNLPTASATNRGALSTTDWTTFNNKVGASDTATMLNPYTRGSGTSGQVGYWNGTRSLTGNSNLFWDNANGRLGIGTASPSFNLDVNGTARVQNETTITSSGTNATLNVQNNNTGYPVIAAFLAPSTSASGGVIMRIGKDATNNASFTWDNTANTFYFQTNSNNFPFEFQGSINRFNPKTNSIFLINNTEAMRIATTRNVLIGTTTDAGFRLDVNGTARVQGNTLINTTYSTPANNAGNLRILTTNAQTTNVGGSLGLGGNGANANLTFALLQSGSELGHGDRGYFSLYTNGTGISSGFVERLRVTSNGTLSLNHSKDNTASTVPLAVYGSASQSANLTSWFNSGNSLLAYVAANGLLGTSASITASSGLAQGVSFANTLVAAANNDVLVGLDINPTFTNGAFTGVSNIGLRIGSSILINGTASVVPTIALNGLGANNNNQYYDFRVNGSSKFQFGYTQSSPTNRFFIYNAVTTTDAIRITESNNNVGIGTTTDAGYKLDVNGTARFNVGGGETKLQTNTQNFVSHNRTSSSGILGFDIRTSGTQNSFWTYDNVTGDVNFGQTALVIGALKLFTANTERMRIFYNGNVGINQTTDAGFRLDVNGTARVATSLTTPLINGVTGTGYIRLNNSNGFEGGYNEGTGGAFQAGGSQLTLNIGTTKILYGNINGIAIGKGESAPVASAQVEITSTTRGFLPPRMTTTQQNAISSPAAGLLLVDNTVATNNILRLNNGTGWGSILNSNPTVTASAGAASGFTYTPSLTAAANNDVLVGLDVNPTFTNGAFTGVSNTALRVQNGDVIFQNNFGLYVTGTNKGLWGTLSRSVGVFFNSNGDIGFRTNLTDSRFTILNNGNIQIGTNTDAGYKIDINGTARVQTSAYFATSSGSVGIGTTAPEVKLDVKGTSTGALTGMALFRDASTNGNGLLVRAGTGRVDLLSTWISSGINTDLTFTPTTSGGVQNEVMRVASTGNVGIGTTSPNASSLLDISSTTKGFLPPRMTTAERDLIATPAAGLVIFNTTLNQLSYYNGTSWINL